MQGFVSVIFFKKGNKSFLLSSSLTVDGWFHFFSSEGLGKSEVTSILFTEARICFYNLCMYSHASLLMGIYKLQQLFRLLQGQTKIIGKRTFC